MLTALLARLIPANLRVLTFAIAIFACLPAVVLFSVQLVLSKNGIQATAAALLCGAAILGSLTHASILRAVTSSKGVFFWLADALFFVSLVVAFGGMAVHSFA